MKIRACPLRELLTGALLLLVATAQADWPDFRGPTDDGHAPAGALPLHWSEKENVKWKTAIPHRGWSTPVVLGRQIWLTTATADGHDYFVICADAETGKIVFQELLFHSEHPEPLGNDLNGYASPSPVVESGRVYVHFGSYGTACLDTATFKVIWKRSDLPCRHYRGPGSSPFLFKELLVLTMDGVDQQYVAALDKRTGKTVWRTDRTAQWNDLQPDGKPLSEGDMRKAFSTPVMVEVNGRQQLLSLGSKAVYGYEPMTGKEIWKVRFEGFSGAARPLIVHDKAFIASGHGKSEILAVRMDGQGDVTDTHVAWRVGRGAPRMPSPVLVDGLLFVLADGGIVSCLESATGTQVWQERIGGDYAASMLYGDGRLYCFSQDGKATVLKASRNYEVLATNKLGDGFMASPAVAGNALVLRTKTSLYRIETSAAAPEPARN